MEPKQRLATIMFTDIVGYTAFMQKDEALAQKKRTRHREVFQQLHEIYDGQIIQYFGDGTLSIFTSSVNAVNCAIEMQSLLKEPIEVPLRIGLHMGEIVLESDDIIGDAVNLASRIESLSVPGGVLISDILFETVKNQKQFQFRPMGTFQLKNVERPFELYALSNEGLIVPHATELQGKGKLQSSRQNNLPKLLSSFLGRDKELRELRELIRKHRLITFTGPGGIGKTRLFIQLAMEVEYQFPDGVFWIPLSSINDPEVVAFTLARELGLKEDSLLSIEEVLIQYLRDKRILLVLDNFEQILEAASIVETLLLSCEVLKILVSSRIILQIAGEIEYQVLPLALPRLNGSNSMEQLKEVPAIALFFQRTKTHRRNFILTEENIETVVNICFRLDGLPLAIELAAARTKLFSPKTLLDRLSNRLDVLKGGPQFADRHQTLRRTIAWSYDMLGAEEQELFRRVSVFTGGSNIEAIEEVCGQNGLADWDVQEGIIGLTDKSLIKSETEGEDLRFYMLETIREYAIETLKLSENDSLIKNAHVHYYLQIAEDAAAKLSGSEGNYWSSVLLREQANFRAAIDYAIELGEMSLAYRLGAALRSFWLNRGMLMEGIKQLEKITAVEVPASLYAERLKVLQALGMLYTLIPMMDQAIAIFEESLTYRRQQKNKMEIGLALNNFGWVCIEIGKYVKGKAYSLEAKSIFEDLEDSSHLVASVNNLGWAYRNRGRPNEAIPFFLQTFQITAKINDDRRNAFALMNLGYSNFLKGNYEKAETQILDSIGRHQKKSDKVYEVLGLACLGFVKYAIGDFDASFHLGLDIEKKGQEINANWAIAAAWQLKALHAFRNEHLENAVLWIDKAVNIFISKVKWHVWIQRALYDQANIALINRDKNLALKCCTQLLENEIDEGSFTGFLPGLEIAARIASNEEKYKEAALFFFNAQRLREELETPIFLSEKKIYSDFLQNLKDEISQKNLKLLKNRKLDLQDLYFLANDFLIN